VVLCDGSSATVLYEAQTITEVLMAHLQTNRD